MPRYVIEREFLVPVYEHILVEAPNLESACREALDENSQPWGNDARFAYDDARPVIITEAVQLPESVLPELQAGDDDLDLGTLDLALYHSGLDLLAIPERFARLGGEDGDTVGFS